MAALRKASAYSKKKARPYTRVSARRQTAYIKQRPVNRIVKMNMGNKQAYNGGKYPYEVTMVSEEQVQIRDNSLEACRQLVNKLLDKNAAGDYYFEVKVYPHHIMRENKTAAGAGADRLSSGMKHSFGVIIGRAAMVSPGKEIFYVSCGTEKSARAAREALTS
jgi:large subunit ribosomal protein L10e